MSNENANQDVAFIRALADLIRESDLNEIEVKREYGEQDELKVRLSRGAPAYTPPLAPAPAPTPQAAPSPAPAQQPGQTEPVPQKDDSSNALTSPMVGTVYLASEPGADHFVNVGDTVSEGDTVLIIEAMKTMNQIAAPKSGVVRKILVDNGEPVEFGAALMVIE